VYGLLDNEEIVEELQLDKLPADLQQKLNRALEDYKSGNYIIYQQMKERIKSWRMK
jgi:hypothetical protein